VKAEQIMTAELVERMELHGLIHRTRELQAV